MARTMKKFSAGGAQGRYERRMADIEKDYAKAAARKTGKDAEVAEAKRQQRIADAKDDLAKRTGADRTATRAAEAAAESNLTKTRKYGAPKAVTTMAPTSEAKIASVSAPLKSDITSKPSSFKEAFKDARSRLGAGKTFTFGGKSYTTNIAGEGRKAAPAAAKTAPAAAKTAPAAAKTAMAPATQTSSTAAILQAYKVAREKAARDKAAREKAAKQKETAPAAKSYETPAEAKARVAGLTGSAGRRQNLAGMFGISSVDNAKARAQLLAAREKEKALNAARRKGSTPLASGTDTGAFFTYGKAAAEKNTANNAKGGKVKKKKENAMKYNAGGSTPPKPTATDRARSKKQLDSLKKAKVTSTEAKVLGSANRSEGPGYKKGGKAKGKPFAATKFGAAMVKKSADTKGRAMVKKYASGGLVAGHKSADGCAVRGKTKGKMLASGGSCGMMKGRK